MYARVLAVLTMAGLVIFGAVTVQAAEATATLLEEPAIADAIAQAMQAGNYAEARQQIDQRIEAGDANADYLWYLKGRSLHYEGKYDEAVAAFDQFADKHADSPWARRVRFAKAASLVRMNGYRRAEEIYRGEAEELLSPARKQSIANVYLEFADRYFEKQDEQTPPDYAKALEFYRQAAEIGPADDRKLDVAMRIARCQQRLNQLDAAIALFQSFVAEYKDDPLAIEATFELGQCYFAAQRWVDARVTWQDLLSRWSTSDSERIAEATYDLALTYQLPQPPSTPALDMGVAAARNFIEKYPQHPWLGKAYLLIAQSYKSVQRIDDAQRALDEFLKDQRNAARDEYPESLFLLGQCQQLRNEFDAALATWRRYLQDFPAHRRWHEAQQAIIDTEYQIAAKARQDRQYDLARNQFEAFLTKYPLDHRISEVMYTLGEMQYQQQRWQAAIDDWRNVVMKFADTDVASRAQYRIAVTYEQHLSQFEKALEEYRKVAKGARVHDAQQRIAQLIAKSMAICTERTFRTDEMPQVKLTCRNLESVTVRVYSIDLETYFRKMHLATGVEQLDVSLIDPDMTFEFQVPNYERYREVVGHIPIEGPDAESNGPSVRVVTVSSDSLEATTLVLRSDLEVVCQSSRDEVFVFAENLRTESPFANVRVLVSDGNKVIEEGTTNEQGIYQKSLNELQTSNDVRIFAVADGHTASNVTLLQGLEVSRGLSEKGYLYTDRSVYQAGQPVNIRGIVRSVADDTYRVDEGHVYELTITDPRNRHVWQESVQLNRFGSFHASLVLPGASVQGTYRVGIADDRGRTYEASFLVQQYTLENIQFTVESDRQIYFRGEPITGKILARYYYGAPLADRAVRYRLGEGRIFTGRTNADGEVAFELETQALHESQVVQFAAELPDHNLSVEVPYVVAAQQFSLAVETSRSVFVSGESWEVVVRAVDAEGKPTSRDVTVKVFQRTNVNGQVGERLVKLTKQATTDAGTGEARIALSLADGGEYAVRAEAVDRLGNPVSGSRIVRISGDDDSTRLRILVDRHAYKVGEVLETQIHWREPPALALVTYQGARVLGYQITKLATGTNTLSLPVTEALAPNFELSVCVMTDPKQPGAGQQQRERNDESSDEAQPTRFHTASAPFQVSRALVVTLTPEFPDGGSHAVPGEILPVRIKVSDPQGRPVEGELSLAMIQQATIDRFGAGRSAIARFFQGEPRQNSVRTSSSITFSYHPDSQRINANVLAELDRLAVAASEAAAIDALPELAELANAPTPAAGIPVEDLFDNGQVAASGTLGGVDDQLFANGVPPQHGGYAGEGMSEGQTWEQLGNNLADGERQQRGRFSAGRYGYGMPANQATDRGEPTPTASKLAIDASESQRRGSIRVNFEDIPRLQQQLRQINRQQGDSYAIALADNGIMAHVNLAAVDDRYLQRIAGQVRDNVTLFTGAGTSETGYWNPAIVTDGNGEALVEIPLSGESLAWHVAVLATTTDTLVGEATTKWLARKDLIGQLKLPAALIDGDTAHVEAHVDDFRANKTPLEVTLVTTIGDRRMEQTKSIGEGDDAIRDVTFVVDVQRPDGTDEKSDVTANFELSIKAADRVEVTQRTVAVEPNGLPVFGMSSGTAQGDTTVWVEFPAFLQGVSRPQLQIAIGPSVEQSLLDVLFGPVLRCGMLNEQVAAQSDSTVSDVMAALALQDLLSSGAEEDHPQQAAIDARIRAAVGLLVSLQGDDGGWSWTGSGGSDRYVSSRIVWALSIAKKHGYGVTSDVWQRAVSYLKSEVGNANDDESRAVLLHALAAAESDEFPLANRLLRNRPALNPIAQLYLAMALVEMGRATMADPLVDLLKQYDWEQLQTSRRGDTLPWSYSQVEMRALYAMVLQHVRPQEPQVTENVQWLLAHRVGARWAPDRSTGVAMQAVCQWYTDKVERNEPYVLRAFVNRKRVGEWKFARGTASQVVSVPAELLVAGKQRVNFELEGRGRYSYQCVLEGFIPAAAVQDHDGVWSVTRTVEPVALEMDGKAVPRGFDLLQGSYQTFRNPLTQLPVGRRGHVELNIRRKDVRGDTRPETLEYLVVTEPIPGGTAVIENSISGGFERYELNGNTITFYIGNRPYVPTISYDVHGYLPGEYRVLPTIVRDAYRLDNYAVAKPYQLEVLPSGAQSSDDYRLTPRELFEIGKYHFERRDMQEVTRHLDELIEKWNVQPEILKQSVTMLLDARLEVGPASRVVQHFEMIKEKWPELEIPYEKILRVGRAYHEMGEYERCYLIFRATVESNFLTESRVSGFLQSQDELVRGISFMQCLLREYPPEPFIAAATFDLAQQVYALAPQARNNEKLREQKITRVDLVRKALVMLNGFLSAYPQDPGADQAAFSLVTGLLELEQFASAIEACQRAIERYPDTHELDRFWYTIGYCHFAQGNHQEALGVCQKVSEMEVKEPSTGRMVPSDERFRALYILGQIHHSLGEAAQAIARYQQVIDRFSDAREAIEYFTRQSIAVPEVTSVDPGKPPTLEIQFRNIRECELRVYRIDLMKFGLMQRDLNEITKINLAGIRPYHERSLQFGDGKDYRDRTEEVTLPLEEEGAYLVVCRGDELHASGMMLVTPLKLEIQEESSAGRVRATVRDSVADRYVPKTHVKVIGSRNDTFQSGESDLRGVFVADDIRGEATVIAQAATGQYAFYRGREFLGPRDPVAVPQHEMQQQNGQPSSGEASSVEGGYGGATDTGGKQELLEGIYGRNSIIQRDNYKRQQEQLYNDYEGVRVDAVK